MWMCCVCGQKFAKFSLAIEPALESPWREVEWTEE